MDVGGILLVKGRIGDFEIRNWVDVLDEMFCIGKYYIVLNTTFGRVGICIDDFENDNICGFDLRYFDLEFGCGKWLWISGKRVGICYGRGLWKSGVNISGRWLGEIFRWVSGSDVPERLVGDGMVRG